MKSYFSCAFRGRGDKWQHQLEIRSDGASNCITSTTKDFLVLEKASDCKDYKEKGRANW